MRWFKRVLFKERKPNIEKYLSPVAEVDSIIAISFLVVSNPLATPFPVAILPSCQLVDKATATKISHTHGFPFFGLSIRIGKIVDPPRKG
jgi:hypothetical protein